MHEVSTETSYRTRRTVVGHFGIVVAKKRDARTEVSRGE